MTDKFRHPHADAPWDFFDRIYCISLTERDDRRTQAAEEFGRVGLAGRVEFHLAVRHPDDCERGIYESHRACLRKGLAAGARNILIFEDDIVFSRYSAERLGASVAFLENHPDWSALFLGCLVKKSRPTESPAVVRITYRCLAHAYALNRPLAEIVATKPWSAIPYDVMLSRFKGGLYAVYPSFAFQSDAPSDNARHRRLDRFRRWCGGLQRIQKANEWCHRHRNLIIGLHVVGLLAVLFLVLRAI